MNEHHCYEHQSRRKITRFIGIYSIVDFNSKVSQLLYSQNADMFIFSSHAGLHTRLISSSS